LLFDDAYIPYGAYWSSPFCRWQGALAGFHSMKLAAQCAKRFLDARGLAPSAFDGLALGITVPQRHSFYGAPWLAAMLGSPELTGATVSQACATSARMLYGAALEVECGMRGSILAVACDRTSNGPHVYYPDPAGAGGTGDSENPVLDNFNADPNTGAAMVRTAETVAQRFGIGRREQDEITLLRYEQYAEALADDRAFQRRYLLPIEIVKKKKAAGVIEADEGVFPTTASGLASLEPVTPGGTVTFGTQTHPAYGNAGLVVCDREHARGLGRDARVTIRLRSFGEARVEKGLMPTAVVPAARQALERAHVRLDQCAAIKTHNPFAVNDAYFCREMGVPAEKLNRYGSPLVWGHPQAPTGLRAVIELIEELVRAGGGRGLFSGCAAGDTAMALVLEVDVAP
jgi:acetyl-CoA acetyltransferase